MIEHLGHALGAARIAKDDDGQEATMQTSDNNYAEHTVAILSTQGAKYTQSCHNVKDGAGQSGAPEISQGGQDRHT